MDEAVRKKLFVKGERMIIETIIIICMNGKEYCFPTDEIQHWDFDYSPDILRIDFKDNSFVEFYKQNLVCVRCNTKERSYFNGK